MAARQLSWGMVAFDVEAAFLNTPLSTEEAVLITPPKLMLELGIIPEDTTWVARRAIYGLKQSPTEWQTARDAALDDMHIAVGPIDTLGTLVLVLHPLDLSAGLWAIRSDGSPTRLVMHICGRWTCCRVRGGAAYTLNPTPQTLNPTPCYYYQLSSLPWSAET